MSERTAPKRTAEMWYRDLCASVEFLSESPDAQITRMEQWQIDADAIKRRFQLEWEEFKRLHHTPIPLKIAGRLDFDPLIASVEPHWSTSRSGWYLGISLVVRTSTEN